MNFVCIPISAAQATISHLLLDDRLLCKILEVVSQVNKAATFADTQSKSLVEIALHSFFIFVPVIRENDVSENCGTNVSYQEHTRVWTIPVLLLASQLISKGKKLF